MASQVQICNRALSTHLGVGRINSLTEATPAAEQCTLHYDDTLKTLLELHRWSFAQAQQALAEKATNPLSAQWDYAYQLPANCLNIHWVNDAQTARDLRFAYRDPDTDRMIMEDTIYSNVPDASIGYTALITDPTKYHQQFANALSASLAANMALSLTENGRLARDAMDMAERLLERAIVHDESLQRIEEVNPVPEWLDVRGVGLPYSEDY